LRTEFRPHLWEDKLPHQTLVQRWFPGDHSDIGGGHEERGLASASFSWMLSRARASGLIGLDTLVSFADSQKSAAEPIHQMWHKFPYSFLEPAVREEVRLFTGLDKTLILGHELDPSAIARLQVVPPDSYGRFLNDTSASAPINQHVTLLREIDFLTAGV
jgi:hypothetical protein